jgi:hypothetical protein
MGCEYLVEITTLVVTIAGFALTIMTLRKGRKDFVISNIMELKKMLNDYSDINLKLYPDGEWNKIDFDFNEITISDFSKFNGYVGIFEIAKLMIENKSLTENEFETFFIYRLRNISHCEPVMKNILENKNDWANLIDLMKQFNLYQS